MGSLWRATHLEEALGTNALAAASGAVQGGVVQQADWALLQLQLPHTSMITEHGIGIVSILLLLALNQHSHGHHGSQMHAL